MTTLPNPTMTSSLDGGLARIRQFHTAFNAPSNTTSTSNTLSAGTPAHRLLRARLLLEEYVEFLHALGARDPAMLVDKMLDQIEARIPHVIKPEEEFNDEVDMAACAHELSDVMVIALGTMDSMGIPSRCFDVVMDANMSKLDSNGKPVYRSDGKIMKGPNYKKPDIAAVLFP